MVIEINVAKPSGKPLETTSTPTVSYTHLLPDYNINLISPESTRFEIGISITSIQMSKGLEFDEVIILNVNHDNYKTEYDRSLLYIAVTRCMHQLTIMYVEKPSHFLP